MAELPARVTGRSVPWARDLAIVTGASAYLAPWLVWGAWSMSTIAGVCGVLTGVAIGVTTPWLLERVRGRVPLPVLAALGFGVGAAWGAGVGAFVGIMGPTLLGPTNTALAAAMIGSVQLGLFWFPYTFLTVLGRPTWPVVVASSALAPVVGWLVFSALL
ncbi:MAG: hypothetical protein KTR31_36295 [Myxococcales bacterium]|nr:hypothetical protein [Myxococcales bacterium]